jgi:hypothetical protein
MNIRRYIARRRGELRATTDTIAVTLNTALTDVDVLGNDRGNNFRITEINDAPIVDGGAAVAITNGTVALDDGLLTITPTNAYTGAIAFRYTVTDGRQVRVGQVRGSVT